MQPAVAEDMDYDDMLDLANRVTNLYWDDWEREQKFANERAKGLMQVTAKAAGARISFG